MKRLLVWAVPCIALLLELVHLNDMMTDSHIQAMPKKADRGEYAVLVHGLLSGPRAMRKIEAALRLNGYRVINFGYTSRKQSIREASEDLRRAIDKSIPAGAKKIHFVTHSLGTIVVRYYLAARPPKNLGRFVMIAPPNNGSQWGRKLMDSHPVFHYILGVAGAEVRHSPTEKLPHPPPCEVGIIAGGTGGRGLNPAIAGDNDGTIAVEETKLAGMKDYILILDQHTLLLKNRRVIDNVISFLGTGKFLF